MRHDRYDVVVVGARAAGAATAAILARAGLSVLVVDRSRYGGDTLSTHALMRGGVLQLRRWGLLDRVVDAGTPPVRRTSFHYASERVTITIKPSNGVDALYAPRRTVLDPILVDAAEAAGAEVRYGVTVVDVRRSRSGRVVGITGRDEHGRRVAVGARLVVGADGLRSTVAERVGAPIEHRGRAAGAVVYGYWAGVPADGYEWIFRSGAAAGLIPTNGGLTCVFAGAPPRRIGRGGRAVLDAVLRQASPDVADRVADGVAPDGVRTFTGRPGYLRTAHGPGWALVGDAASWKDPLSTHGLTDAFRDAELLARAAVVALADPADEREAMAGYQALRDHLTLPLLGAVDAIASYRWRDDEIGGLLLQLSSAMADEVDVIAGLDPLGPPVVSGAGAVGR